MCIRDSGKQRRCGDQRRLICLDVERIIDVDVEAQDVLLCKAVCFGKAADDGSDVYKRQARHMERRFAGHPHCAKQAAL